MYKNPIKLTGYMTEQDHKRLDKLQAKTLPIKFKRSLASKTTRKASPEQPVSLVSALMLQEKSDAARRLATFVSPTSSMTHNNGLSGSQMSRAQTLLIHPKESARDCLPKPASQSTLNSRKKTQTLVYDQSASIMGKKTQRPQSHANLSSHNTTMNTTVQMNAKKL